MKDKCATFGAYGHYFQLHNSEERTQQTHHPCRWWGFTSCWICHCLPCLCHDVFPCGACPGQTSCLPFCGTLPCRICWTSWQSLPSWELRQTSSSGNADSSMDSPGSFPGNSGEEAAVSQVRDLWTYAPSQVRRECGPQPPWGGPRIPSDALSAAAW